MLLLFDFVLSSRVPFPGTAIWHPRCGPGPTENGTVLNGSLENGHCTDGESGKEGGREFDHMSSSAVSEMQASTGAVTTSSLAITT